MRMFATWILILIAHHTYACFDINQIIEIANDLGQSYEQTICQQEFSTKEINRIINKSLKQIMKPDFLGTEPPKNWELLSQELLSECPIEGNICKKEVQVQFTLCAQNQLALIFMILSPWLNEHCQVLNEQLIQHWPLRKSQLIKIIQTVIQNK